MKTISLLFSLLAMSFSSQAFAGLESYSCASDYDSGIVYLDRSTAKVYSVQLQKWNIRVDSPEHSAMCPGYPCTRGTLTKSSGHIFLALDETTMPNSVNLKLILDFKDAPRVVVDYLKCQEI